jgi:hypothetical protein
MITEIRLGRVNVTAVQNNANVLYGDNILKGWQSRTKSNAALGRVNGDRNIIASRLNYLNDPDFIDMFVKTTGGT